MNRMQETASKRFWRRVDKSADCWVWTGSVTKKGYGIFSHDKGHSIHAHRFAYQEKHGPIPVGLKVLHRCDNPPCCRDEHLFLGTDADNAADREAKGRGASHKGELNGRSKLTWAKVDDIRRIRSESGIGAHRITKRFGIGRTTAQEIIDGKKWLPEHRPRDS